MKLMRPLFAVLLLLIPGLMFGQSSGSNKVCNQNAILDAATATTQLVAAPTVTTTIFINGVGTQVVQQMVHICHVQFRITQTTTAANFGLAYGTGTNCATGITNLTPQWRGVVSVTDAPAPSEYGTPSPLNAPPGKAVCLRLSAAPTNASVLITYGVW